MKPDLVVLFQEYDPERYPESFSLLQSYLNKGYIGQLTYLRIDNRNQGDYVQRISDSVYKVGGDNSSREFSGWQRGLDVLNALAPDYRLVLFVNEAFLNPGRSFLEKRAGPFLFLKPLVCRAAVGRIQEADTKIFAFGRDVSRWLCTNSFLMPRKILEEIKNVVTIDQAGLDRIMKPRFGSRVLVRKSLSRADFCDGHFSLSARADSSKDHRFLRIEIDNSHVPGTKGHPYRGRELGLFIRNLSLNEREVEASSLRAGWYPRDRGGRWIKRIAEVERPDDSPASVSLEGYIPEDVFQNLYRGQAALTISTHTGYFNNDAPLSESMRTHLIEWMMLRWHSRLTVTAGNFGPFREKVAAILNELMLSARIREKGYRILHYDLKEYWMKKFKTAVYRSLLAKRRRQPLSAENLPDHRLTEEDNP